MHSKNTAVYILKKNTKKLTYKSDGNQIIITFVN